MKLYQLLAAYDFNELMPVINEMFPGTGKYREPLEKAYDMLMQTTPAFSKKVIRYKVMQQGSNNEQYVGAEDVCFEGTWEMCLGKEVSKEKGVDLTNEELAANCLVNLCLISKYPKAFESYHSQLLKQ